MSSLSSLNLTGGGGSGYMRGTFSSNNRSSGSICSNSNSNSSRSFCAANDRIAGGGRTGRMRRPPPKVALQDEINFIEIYFIIFSPPQRL